MFGGLHRGISKKNCLDVLKNNWILYSTNLIDQLSTVCPKKVPSIEIILLL
jgi:hypothetical protein